MAELSGSSLVELSVCARNLPNRSHFSKSDPFCVLFVKDSITQQWREHGRTETIHANPNPDFATKLKIDFLFGDAVKLKFEMYDKVKATEDLKKQTLLGLTELMLGDVIAARRGLRCNLSVRTSGSCRLLVQGQEMDHCKSMVRMHWMANGLDKMDTLGKSDPYLTFHRLDSNGFKLIHRTEEIRNTLNPTWKPFDISLNTLCNGDRKKQIKIKCWDWNANGIPKEIGEFDTTYETLVLGACIKNTYECINMEKKLTGNYKNNYKNSGQITLTDIKVINMPTFLDYIRSRSSIHCMFAVDFGKAHRKLHQRNSGRPNMYEQALRAVGTIMQSYDRLQSFPVLGFGAPVQQGGYDRPVFHMNGHPKNPSCHSLDGVLKAYEQTVRFVRPIGKTNMAPLIEYAAKLAEGFPPGDHYHVLVIATSGAVHDMSQTISAIVNASSLPLSIILIGIGDDQSDFEDMKRLDADDQLLKSGDKSAKRDIVQFVPFHQHIHYGENEVLSQQRLARAVLDEVPEQLTSYMKSQHIQPDIKL